MSINLAYRPLEKIKVRNPVYRIPYILRYCKNKRVLDIGCYDEAAVFKKGTGHWLHEEIKGAASYVLGIDNSSSIPDAGIISDKDRIIKMDACNLDKKLFENNDFDLIVAGELIEHLPDTAGFFQHLKNNFSGKQLICTTPNAFYLGNLLLGAFKRECTHACHLQIYSYKTLNIMCERACFSEWEIIPYHVYFTEAIFKTRGVKKGMFKIIERCVNALEYITPLLSGGLILHVKKI
ncbi:MAG: methyltransferase domain-containing protein [Candidatus Omnitrophota bacterium]|nr:methyltransferase domain-containing protein [Candidatus Omnitrophota bacterium]